MHWAIADGLGLIPKDGPQICHHNFDPSRKGWLPRFGTPRGTVDSKIIRALAIVLVIFFWFDC